MRPLKPWPAKSPAWAGKPADVAEETQSRRPVTKRVAGKVPTQTAGRACGERRRLLTPMLVLRCERSCSEWAGHNYDTLGLQ